MNSPCYVLLTAAYNEESFIAETIESIVSQTVLPTKWVIVSDGSSDRTDEIVQRYANVHQFIKCLRVERTQPRGVGSKINALSLAHNEVESTDYQFVGNVDADVSLQRDYFETLLARFEREGTLGITGGMVYERQGREFRARLSNSVSSVAHAAQLVRRECYRAIGGYRALKYGGEDWYAEVDARMKGWHVEAIANLAIMHHRVTGSADWSLRHCFREGRMDFSVGSLPTFELFKCVRRIPERPLLVGAILRLAGFCSGYATKEERVVSAEFVRFLRTEQKHRLKGYVKGVREHALTTLGSGLTV
jgi:glycosyltransferase involved in cell wall biosynthesis